MIRHRGPISGIAAFNDTYVATAGYDNQLILWEAVSKRAIARAAHDHLANQTVFSPDGRYLLSSSSDYTARLWSVPDLKLVAVLSDQEDDVEMSVFHPRKDLIATASRDHRVRVYDFSGTVRAVFHGHTADVISVEWDAHKDELISSSDDGTIKRWSLETNGMIDDIDLDGIETDTVAITREGTIYAGNDEGEIITVEAGGTRTQPAHAAGIKRLVYNPVRGLLVSLSYDRTLRIWDTKDGLTAIASSSLPSDIWPRSCAFLNETTLVFATFGSSYAVYDLASDQWNLDGIEATPCVNAVARVGQEVLTIGDAGLLWADAVPRTEVGSLCNFLTPVGSRVFTGGQMGTVFDALTGEVLHQHRSPLNCGAAFEREGVPHVVVGTYTGEGLLFSVQPDGRVVHEATLDLHENAVKGVAVSGNVIFSVCADSSASWFSTETLEQLKHLPQAHGRIANGCAAVGSAGDFASVSRDLKLRIWRGADSVTLDTPHDHSIKCVSASDDGAQIATAAYNGLVAVYDVHRSAWASPVRPTTSGISSLCWDALSGRFLAGSYDGNVYPVTP